VAEALQRTPRQLPSKYFYDALGSSLFDAICGLPWYKVTRAESALLASAARAILEPWESRPGLHNSPGISIAELGCGNGEKLEVLLQASRMPIQRVHLIDISAKALELAETRLAQYAGDGFAAYEGTYEHGLARVAATRQADETMLCLFLGSNIGNFDPPAARDLLTIIRASLRPGDGFLLGSDLVKPERDLLLAYGDPLGVTAAFNLNLLRRINDELGGTFDLEGFAHRAVWNRACSRIESHLISRRRQDVQIAAAGLTLAFEPDEAIWTESSYKYEPSAIVDDGRAAGFSAAGQWIDEDARFALTRFTV
jgi:dimethylhistidine N-methyltransferase